MLAESLEHLGPSNNAEEETNVQPRASPLIDTPFINEEIIAQFNEDSEGVEDDVKSGSCRDTICAFSGHSFYRKSLSKPAYCHHCSEVIWGPLTTGFTCDVCNFLAHEKCLQDIVTVCPAYAATQILTPVAHCWSELTFFLRKFCNVCRTRLRDTPSVRCEVCEYYAHYDCKEFAVNDCKQGAAYRPQRNRVGLTNARLYDFFLSCIAFPLECARMFRCQVKLLY
ncbi:unnamed protein product [Rodentolepis nana]|uniref:Phorbol-ester/DAG-type domain-containing protein n=1 Tax=Rodentolepis nana TaxID=102285 RepID=A0A0R3T3X9_RODNA|nr:unnamed protein product [Rodentolepis nana]